MRNFLFLSLIVFWILGYQKSAIAQSKDSTTTDSLRKHSTKVATWCSVLVPGLGQVYNKRYWKIPMIYTGFGVFLYLSNFNNQRYQNYSNRNAAYGKPGPYFPYDEKLSKEQLQNYKKKFKRDRDFNYIMIGLVYVMNILDATVDAYLYTYDVKEELSFRILPNLDYSFANMSLAPGIKFSLNF